MGQTAPVQTTDNQNEFKVNNFDLLRLIAATQVIADHYFQHLNIPISKASQNILYLFPGVPMFFVISGYLISASLERNSNLLIYFKNRALRIFPGLWGVILVTIIVFSFTGVSFFSRQVITWLPAQLAGLIYTPAFLANYGFGSYNGSLWTLPIELQFYIVLPICYFLAPKNKINIWFYWLLALFTILNLAIFLYLHYQYGYKIGDDFTGFIPKLISYLFVPYFYLFLIGVVLQRLQIYKSRFIRNRALYWVIGYILFSLLLSTVIDPLQYYTAYSLFLVIKNVLLAFTIISMAYTLPNTASKLLHTNDMSYGIYIYHGLILTVLVQLKLTGYVNLFMVIAATYVLAWLSWIFIEKPFIKKKEKTIRAVGASE
jgi:peptidoglycan/LPS O-acetylase OafA/YrhL